MFEDFYGLTGKPFQLSPDPAFFYSSKGHSSAFSYLKYGVYQGEGFLVITGEIGAGKTTLVRALLEELDVHSIVAAQIVSTQLDGDDLLRSVAKAFGIRVPSNDKASLLAAIEGFLLTLFQQSKRALLIIDEAQNLNAGSLEELRMLSNFQCGDQALLQSFLVGQPELRSLMRSPLMEQFRQRVIASYHLGPLDEPETRAYIEHRLHRVAWKGDPEFDPAAFHRIYLATGGVPRRINSLCNRLFLSGYLSGQHTFGVAEVAAVVAEIDSEVGHEAIAPPRDPVQPAVGMRDPGASLRRILSVADRVDGLERNLNELLDLVRGIVEPERSLPVDEPRRQSFSPQPVREAIEPERSLPENEPPGPSLSPQHVRENMEPERALPEEEPPRIDPPRRKRKSASNT
jgi:putative secretion ATPase (PEP-CTERM system associated)